MRLLCASACERPSSESHEAHAPNLPPVDIDRLGALLDRSTARVLSKPEEEGDGTIKLPPPILGYRKAVNSASFRCFKYDLLINTWYDTRALMMAGLVPGKGLRPQFGGRGGTDTIFAKPVRKLHIMKSLSFELCGDFEVQTKHYTTNFQIFAFGNLKSRRA